ncbi:MAG TPA: DUF1735 domain-containing protein [Segetibacter sp.]|jgi:hypothetical protein
MKKIIFNNLLLLVAISATFTSCLKDKGYDEGKYGAVRNTAGQEFMSIPVAARIPNTQSLESKAGSQNIPLFVVSYDYVDPAASDITGTITLNNALVKAADTSAVLLPTSIYSIPSNTITVKAGQRVSDRFIMTINTSTLDPTKKYGIGFTLSSVSKGGVAIPSNLKDVVYIFSLKNVYDGIYTVMGGFVQRYSAPGVPTVGDALNGDLAGNPDVTFTTQGPTTVEITGLNWAKKGGGIGGIDNLRLTVDPATNQVTMFALGNATLANWEGRENRYDPATKTFYLNYRWNPTANRREYSVILKYSKPRP